MEYLGGFEGLHVMIVQISMIVPIVSMQCLLTRFVRQQIKELKCLPVKLIIVSS